VENLCIYLEEFQVYGGNTVLAREYGGDHVVRHEAKFYEVVAQTSAVLALVIERLTQMLWADEILPNENFA